MPNSSSMLTPTLLCTLAFFFSLGCEQTPKPALTPPVVVPVDPSVSPAKPELVATPAPPVLPEHVRVIPGIEGMGFSYMRCPKWDHIARRILEDLGQSLCVSWLNGQTRAQKDLPQKVYHVPESVTFVAHPIQGVEISPELISWHSKHRVFLSLDCSNPLPQGLVYVRCTSQPINGRHLSAVPTIRHVDVSFNKGLKEALPDLGGMDQLESLRIEQSKLDAESLSHLSGLSSLRVLQLIRVGLDDAGLAKLKGLTSLTELAIPYNKGVTDKGLQYIASLKNLKTLDLSNMNSLSNKGLSALASLSALEHLSCGGVGLKKLGFSAKGIHAVGALKNLTYLDTGSLPIDAEGAKQIGSLPKLLKYEGTIPSKALLASFGGLSKLEGLALKGELGADALASLKDLKSLRSLSIGLGRLKDVEPIDDTTLRHIAVFTELRDLRIFSGFSKASSITDVGFAHLSALKHLRQLFPGSVGITSKGLEPLTSLPLRSLNLSRSKVGVDVLPSLLSFTQLQDLTLNSAYIDKETEAALYAGLPACKGKHCAIVMISFR